VDASVVLHIGLIFGLLLTPLPFDALSERDLF